MRLAFPLPRPAPSGVVLFRSVHPHRCRCPRMRLPARFDAPAVAAGLHGSPMIHSMRIEIHMCTCIDN